MSTLEDIDLLPDIPPLDAPENPCEVCGIDVPYGGRGRRPKRCEEHKDRKASTPRKTNTGKNDLLARQASAALGQLNGLLAMGLMMPVEQIGLPLPQTASTIAAANEGFEEAAYRALVTDPKLAALILKGGSASGKVSLLIAYAMFAGAVVPVAMAELKSRREV